MLPAGAGAGGLGAPVAPSSMELLASAAGGGLDQWRSAAALRTARQAAAPLHLRGGEFNLRNATCCCCLRGGFGGLGIGGGRLPAGGSSSISLAQAAAYGATMFGSAAMNNIWVTYYIAFFSARVQSQWFYFGQAVYMVWNAINDPLVGWLSDAAPGLTQRRTPAIMYGGTCASPLEPRAAPAPLLPCPCPTLFPRPRRFPRLNPPSPPLARVQGRSGR